MCPVCTVTVVAGLGISRYFGIDDLITSIWIGGFILSFTFVMIDWIVKKWPKFNISRFSIPIFILMYALVILPLKWNGSMGIPLNTLWNIDKIFLGIVVGSIAFLIGVWADKYQRKVKEKIFFPFQKVIFPVIALIAVSLIFFFLLKYFKY